MNYAFLQSSPELLLHNPNDWGNFDMKLYYVPPPPLPPPTPVSAPI